MAGASVIFIVLDGPPLANLNMTLPYLLISPIINNDVFVTKVHNKDNNYTNILYLIVVMKCSQLKKIAQ